MTSASLSDFASFMVRSIIETKACMDNGIKVKIMFMKKHCMFLKLSINYVMIVQVRIWQNFFKKIMDPMRTQKAFNNRHGHIIYIRTVSS